MSPPAACCGATRRCGVRSRSGPCASPSASGSAGRGWRWHANSRSCCTPCGATARSSSGGGLRHRHQPKTRRHRPDFLRAYAVLSGTAVRSPVREGRGGTRARLPAWRARLLRATPTTRMAPSRSNFPHPAPITCIEPRRERCRLREATGVQGWATPVRKLSNIISAARNCRSVRGCAFGAPLRGCGA